MTEAKANRKHGIIKFRVPIPRRLQTNPYRVLEKGSLNLYPVDGCNALTNAWDARRNCRNESFIVRRIASICWSVSQICNRAEMDVAETWVTVQ